MLFLYVIFATGFLSGTAQSLIAGVAVLIVGAVSTAWIAQRRNKVAAKKEEEKTLNERLDEFTAKIGELHAALVGQKATDLNPNPPPGIVDIVPKLKASMDRVEHTLFVNGGKGNTIVDRMERLEGALKLGVESVQRIEGSQVSQEADRRVRDHE